MLKDKIFFEGTEAKFEDRTVKKIISHLNTSNFNVSDYDYLASGGTASVYQIGEKVLRIGRWYTYPQESVVNYTKIKKQNPSHLVKVYFIDVMEMGNKYYEVLVMERLTPLDQAPTVTKYNVPSIRHKSGSGRHTLVMFFSIIGALLFDGHPITVNNIIESREIHATWNSAYNKLKEPIIEKYLDDSGIQKILSDVEKGYNQLASIDKDATGDISFDNIMYDHKTNKYKLIDFT